jgi:predicted HicB family RNase H-like nuclease
MFEQFTILFVTGGMRLCQGFTTEGGKTMKDTRLNIRMTVELKEQAKKLAEADGRDLTNWITWLIRKEIEKAAEK